MLKTTPSPVLPPVVVVPKKGRTLKIRLPRDRSATITSTRERVKHCFRSGTRHFVENALIIRATLLRVAVYIPVAVDCNAGICPTGISSLVKLLLIVSVQPLTTKPRV